MKKLFFITSSLLVSSTMFCMDPQKMNIFVATQSGNIEQVEKLLKINSTLVDDRDTNQNTPLHLAVTHGNMEIIKLLLHYNAKILVRNNNRKSPLDLAQAFGNPQTIKLLTYWPHYAHYKDKQLEAFETQRKNLKLGNIILIDDMKDYIVKFVRKDSIEEIENLVEHKIMHKLACDGYYRYVKSFLSVNPNLVNALDDNQNTPLHWAAKNGHPNVVILLLQKGALIEVRNKENQTPFYCAITEKHQEIAQLLLDWPYYTSFANEHKKASRRQITTFLMGKHSPDSPVWLLPDYILQCIIQFAGPYNTNLDLDHDTIQQLPDIDEIHEIAEHQRSEERLREQQNNLPDHKKQKKDE